MELRDRFDEIFSRQDALNRRIGVALPPSGEEDRAKRILNSTGAVQQEIAELIDSVPWKWWATCQKFDGQNARVEVVDLFHFLISLAQTLGMSAKDVFQAYAKRNQVDLQRQDSGWVTTDESDSRHLKGRARRLGSGPPLSARPRRRPGRPPQRCRPR